MQAYAGHNTTQGHRKEAHASMWLHLQLCCTGPAIMLHRACNYTAQGLQLCYTGPAIILHRGCNYTAHGPHYQHMVAPGKQNTAIRVVLSTSFGHVTFLRKPLFQAPGDCYETPLYAWFRPHSKTCAPRARNDDFCRICAPRARFASFQCKSVVFSEGLV